MADEKRGAALFEWERQMMARGPLNPTTRHVLHALRTFASVDLTAFPSTQRLAGCTALSDRAVRKHLEIGEREGWFIREARRYGGKAWAQYQYVLTIPPEGAERCAGPSKDGAERGSSPKRRKGAESDVQGAESGAGGTEPGALGAERGDSLVRHDVPTNNEVEHAFEHPFEQAANNTRAPALTALKTAKPKPNPTTKGPMKWAAELGLRPQRQDETVADYIAFVNLEVGKHQEAQQ